MTLGNILTPSQSIEIVDPEGSCKKDNREPVINQIGSEEYLLSHSMGSIHTINGLNYHMVEELWWSSKKPVEVQKLTKIWREKGYKVRSHYKKVDSGKSWNNGPNEMRLYSIYAAYDKSKNHITEMDPEGSCKKDNIEPVNSCICTPYNFPNYPNKVCPNHGKGTKFWNYRFGKGDVQ